MIANVAAAPSLSRFTSDSEVTSSTPTTRNPAPDTTDLDRLGTGADTRPFTCPTRSCACGSRITMANRNSGGSAGRMFARKLSGVM